MSKFLNYVKKFLTLSFISAIAAFCLPFNNHVDAAFVGASAKASSNIYEDSTTGYKYLLKASDSTAEWVGTTNDDAVIDVPAEITKGSTTFSVTKATLGNDFSNVVELNLDVANFVDDDSTESITVKSTENLGRLSKVVLKNYDKPAASGEDSSSGIEETDVNAGALNDILEQNSINGLASWYIKAAADEDDAVGKLIGEANLPSATVDTTAGTAKAPGVTYEKRGDDWYVTEFSNLPTVVLPLAFVDTNTDGLEIVKGLSLDKEVVTSQVNKIIITNIQDTTKVPKIMKLAQSALQGLDNGKNDPVDWELDPKNSNDTMLTFVKVDRDIKPIILDTITEIINYSKTPEFESLSDDQKVAACKDIINKHFANASDADIKMKDLLFALLDQVGDGDVVKALQSFAGENAGDSNATNLFGSSGSGNESTSSDSSANAISDANEGSSSEGSEKKSKDESTPAKSSSLLDETMDNVRGWIAGEGKEKSPKEQMTYIKAQLESIYDKLSDEEKADAKKLIEEVDDTLAALDSASSSKSSSGSSSTGGSAGTSKTSTTTSSAKTKTSDSYASPELLSLILSGSLTGLGLSLKKRYE